MPAFRIVLIAVAVLALSSEASAVVIKSLDFDAGGVLPSTESDIQFSNTTSFAESALYSATGGFLEQRTVGVGVGRASYNFPDTTVTGGGLDPAVGLAIEARLRILQIETAPAENGGGVFLAAFDGVNRYSLTFNATGGVVLSSTGVTPFTFDTSGLHTYRLQSPGGSNLVSLFIDGSLILTTPAQPHTANGFNFGDGISSSGNNADVDWDFVHVSQVPEPSSALLLATGLAGLAAAGKRRAA